MSNYVEWGKERKDRAHSGKRITWEREGGVAL